MCWKVLRWTEKAIVARKAKLSKKAILDRAVSHKMDSYF